MKEGGLQEKDEQKAKLKQAADLFKQAQVAQKRAQSSPATAATDYEASIQFYTQAIALRPNHVQYIVARGKCFVGMQQYERANWDFSQAVRLDPSNAKNYKDRGFCYRKLGRTQQALKDYDEALRHASDKDKADFHFERSLVYIDLEEYHRAIDGLGQALERRFQQQFKAYFYLGICHRRVGQLEKSVEALKQAIQLEASNADYHNHLGLSYVELGSFEEAKKSFASAVELDPCARYLNNHGLAAYHLNEFDEAIEGFSAALNMTPEDPEIHFNLGNARFSKGENKKALGSYDEAIKRDPDNPKYLHHKGLANQGLRAIREAIYYYEQALMRDPNHHPSRFHLGLMFHLDGQCSKALDMFCYKELPADQALHEARGLVYRDMGNYEMALADFNMAIELEPSQSKHYYNRGIIYSRMEGRMQDAIEDYNKALELGSTDACVYNDRGLAWRALQNMAQAVNDLSAAINADGSNTEFLSNRAQCLFEQGLYDRAEMDLTRALEINGKDPHLLYKRGITRYAQRRYGDCIADLKASLQFDPYPGHLADIFYHLGVAYANLGKHTFAVPAFDQAVLRAPERPHFLHERAKSLQVIGEHEKALQDFTRVLDIQPTNARAMFRRAFSFKAQGMYSEAAEDFEAAKEFEPNDPRLVVSYRKVYSVATVSLGPAGHEDPHVPQPPPEEEDT